MLQTYNVILLVVISFCTITKSKECVCYTETVNDTLSDRTCFNFAKCKELQLILNNYTLEINITVSDKTDISLAGSDSGTTILCSKGIGFKFTNITNLAIRNIYFENCGRLYTYSTQNFKVAVLIIRCKGLSIMNTEIRKSDGTGLAMLNATGTIAISNSSFISNRMVSINETNGGGGLYIEQILDYSSSLHGNVVSQHTEFNISNCHFIDNAASITDSSADCDHGLFAGIGQGGAMTIRLKQYPHYVEIVVTNTILSHNAAEWGGAVEIMLCSAQNNYIDFVNSTILDNDATEGGGGIDIAFSSFGTQNNRVFISNTKIKGNIANFGGGVFISTRYAYDQSNNLVKFQNSSWIGNRAHYGSAVDIVPAGVLDGWNIKPEITFENCSFESNYHVQKQIKYNIYRLGDGVIMVTGFTVTFRRVTTFTNNSGSCVYAISSEIRFDSNVIAKFQNNTAEAGAGIALIGFSVISVGNNSEIFFLHNNVTRQGGAIFYSSIDKHTYVRKDRCFIQKFHKSVSNAIFKFLGNKSPEDPIFNNSAYRASSIYSTANIIPCCLNDYNCTFNNAANFSFMDLEITKNSRIDIGEKDFTFDLEDGKNLSLIPGMLSPIPLINSANTTFDVTINKPNNSSIKVVKSHYSIHGKKLIFIGNTGDSARITLTERSNRKYELNFSVEITHCPPLYKMHKLSCRCYTNKDTYYVAFFRCDDNLKASLRIGYWVGYAETLREKVRVLYISYCPNAYCKKTKANKDNYYQLPHTNELETAVCNSNRRGVLCGECVENTTVYFYSRSFKCGKTNHCLWGPIFYLLSEILPLTFLFLFVILFDISFTSGDLNGFIFFAQMYDTIADVGESFLTKDEKLRKINMVSQLIYRFFNLDFFSLNELSFCLWKNANTLSILMFKYVTVAYALILVLGTVLVIRVLSKFRCVRLRKFRYSVIQGLSAFLVLTYSQCTEISFSILNPINIYSGPRKNATVVFLQGNINYFSREHLPYAIPALFCIISFVLTVPLLLMMYPLVNKVITFVGLEENCVFKLTSRLIPIGKIKPLLDCFQGTFKDNYRFFAGLYFAYRAAILASRFAPTVTIIYAVMELHFIIMLTLHTLSWPYQKRIHNITDALLIANLAVITILKLLIHNQVEFIHSNKNVLVLYAIELIFTNLPLVVLSIVTIHTIVKKLRLMCNKNALSNSAVTDNTALDEFFLANDIRQEAMCRSTDSYMLMRERQMEN